MATAKKKIKVSYMFDSDGQYLEIWKVVGKNEYVGRRNFRDDKRWCAVHDAPYGYCEISHDFSENIIFVVCDADGKPLYETYNGDDSVKFLSFEEAAHDAWAVMPNKPENVSRDGRKTWLHEFYNDEVTQRILTGNEYPTCLEDNFLDCWNDKIEETPIHEFHWTGRLYAIFRILNKSRYSEARWYTYMAAPNDGKSGNCQWLGWSPLNQAIENKGNPPVE